MAFRIEWKKSTRKDLRKLPASVTERVVEAVEGLVNNSVPKRLTAPGIVAQLRHD